MGSFIAWLVQAVEHCTGNVKVMDSNSVEA